MNIEQAKKIPIEQILYKIGITPRKTNGSDIWYLSPFTAEKTSSFKICKKLNRWYCHSSGFGGNALDFIVKYRGLSVKDALLYLSDPESSFSIQKQNIERSDTKSIKINPINKILPVQHPALVQYLKIRNIHNYKNIEQLKQIHYTINEKPYFALGFRNESNGWEIRSKFSKICLGNKNVTLINNQSNTLRIFEGFFDYLSLLQMNNNIENKVSDYLILNSVALINKNWTILKNYTYIELYLDNDETGNKFTELIMAHFIDAVDCRVLYDTFKDLNEFSISGGIANDKI